jgi:quinoprotein glucose dehydrogenase
MASMANVTAAKYEEEEFQQVRPETQSRNRRPRWEAEPNYGLRGTNQPGGVPVAPPSGGAAPAAPPAPQGRTALVEGLGGLSIVKPPYGVIAAIDLSNGPKLLFQVPHGETPDAVRNNPLLRGLNIPKTGQPTSVGVMITKTMVVAGDSQVTSPPGRPRGAMLRAYNKQTGAELGEVLMPAPISGSPMTYTMNGRQYIIVGVSGGNYTGEYIAYALPPSEIRAAGN